jgi:glyoxylase-like metal-dependent hydrolase (beta-lactamase superfamily II)
MAMKILEDLHLVGSGNFGISHPTDCNIYLIDAGGTFVLVDAGSGIESDRILENIKRDGIPTDLIEYLILTHAHWDHAGGCRALADRLNCKICAHRLAAPTLSQGNWRTPFNYQVKKGDIKLDIALENEETLFVGEKRLRFISTPGHSPDGISIVCHLGDGLALLSGDTVLANGILGVITKDTNLQEYAKSIRALCDLKPKSLFPGHSIFTLSNAHVHLRLAWEKIETNWYDVSAGPTPFNPSWWWNLSKEGRGE